MLILWLLLFHMLLWLGTLGIAFHVGMADRSQLPRSSNIDDVVGPCAEKKIELEIITYLAEVPFQFYTLISKT